MFSMMTLLDGDIRTIRIPGAPGDPYRFWGALSMKSIMRGRTGKEKRNVYRVIIDFFDRRTVRRRPG
jgi:hypothetical protein